MSFDIFFQTCHLGARTEERRNPFTGRVEAMPADDGPSAAERAAVEKLLRAAGATGPDGSGRFALHLADGGSAAIDGPGPDGSGGWSAAVGSLTPGLVATFWGMSRAGDLAILPALEGGPVVATTEGQRERIRARWPEVVLIDAPVGLGRLLDGGLGAWRSYRDQALAGRGGP